MKFVSNNKNTKKYLDSVFSVVRAAKADSEAINATAGCLFTEDAKLLTFDVVNKCEDKLLPAQKSAYASAVEGNKDYDEAICKFVLDDNVTNNHITIASAGGTGAIYLSMAMCLEDNDTIIIPEISWGNYRVMADEFNLNYLTYDVYNLDDLFNKIDEVNGKVFLIVNSPCQNPLGHAYTFNQWQEIINKLNSLNQEVVLVCDIAYIDYANDNPKQFMKLFNDISDDVLVLICASTSKAFSYYGQRLGALIAINNDKEFLDQFLNLSTRLARSTWSNLNNSGMIVIADVLNNHADEYFKELEASKLMLSKRVELFKKQASECDLELYDSKDGFFVTIKTSDNEIRDEIHQRLIDKHIYTIKVNKGIRVGLCSTPLNIVDGLAKKIKELM